MKTMARFFVLACSTAFAFAQSGQLNTVVKPSALCLSAQTIQRNGTKVECRGNVALATNVMVIHADEMDYDAETGQAELRGNIRVKLLATIDGYCEGTGCVAEDGPQAAAMARVAKAVEKMLATQAARLPK
jgi:lipopolysaccharide assembly outer membrane protein LptD (OstA)